MTVLVCGGRSYEDYPTVEQTLDALDITRVVQGGARGADACARRWASERIGVSCKTYQANWTLHGKAAGAIRNQAMLNNEVIDLVVAFPGGRGTADMVRRATKAGIQVREIRPSRRP